LPEDRKTKRSDILTPTPILGHFIGGKRTAGTSSRRAPVYNPSFGTIQAQVDLASADEVRRAIAAAAAAFPAWSEFTPQRRARILARFIRLVEERLEEIAKAISQEHGKTVADAKAEIQRGLEAVEFACGIPHALKGEFSDNVSTGMDAYSFRQPLGVAAGITPFNFPAMIPMWMFGVALATGNTFVLKPSEKAPTVPLLLGEIMLEAGAPAGVLNVINGDQEAVDTLLNDPRVPAISFVGSSAIAEKIYAGGAARGKRVQAMGGAKNHLIIMPDADLDQAVNALLGAAYGSAGERCMAISVAVPVGPQTAERLLAVLAPRVAALKVGPSLDAASDFGPLVTVEHLRNVCGYIESGVQEGAKLVVDGRGVKIPGHENGFYLSGCLFDRVEPKMKIYTEEIFGPVLSVVRAANFEDALDLASRHQYGNGVAIYTRSGRTAREFVRRVDTGMVGVNVPLPVPLAFYSFGGWKRSSYGGFNQHGMEGVRFYTKTKNVLARWPEDPQGAEFVMPTMK
jgi:malonate-semialdehyde dehydrogenase (acetylating) / methylmalonate-semialdehyde dehydrogenase